jgi:hypothetical protein
MSRMRRDRDEEKGGKKRNDNNDEERIGKGLTR